jgi:hypothetical protein
MNPLLTQMHELLGTGLFSLIMNPKTNRPYLISSLKNRRVYTSLSSGERTLIHLAYDLYNGSGKMNINDLRNLDAENRTRAARSIQHLLENS